MTAFFSAIGSISLQKIAACRRLALAVALVLAWGGEDPCPGASQTTAIVRVHNLNLRSKPTLSSKSLAVLSKGTRVTVVRDLGGWIRVAYGKRTGYLRNRTRYLRLEPGTAGIEKIKKKAASIQRRIKASQAEVVSYTRRESKMVDTLDTLDRALSRARAQVVAARGELAELDGRISGAQAAILGLGSRIRTQEAYAARRLAALYKLNWLGRINILASAESMSGLFHRERALSRILDHDDRVLARLGANRERYRKLEADQTERKQAKLSLENELKARIRQMSGDRDRRSRLLEEIRGKKSMALAAVDNLKQASKALDRKIKALGIGLKKTAAGPRAPVTRPEDQATGPFNTLKGLLNMPVDGKVVSFFGPYKNAEFNVMNFCSGLDIQADRGEPVRAVQGGKILYATWFKGYGNMLIVDHGESYYSVYAHVEEIFKEKGAKVEAGEVIATVGDTGSLTGPKLHFEIRHHGKPLDPMEWINKG